MKYVLKKFWWFVLLAAATVGGSIWAVAAPCPVLWLRQLGEQYLRFGATVVGIGLASHLIGEALPRRWFRYDRRPYLPWEWEDRGKVYERLFHISRWKDAMPDKSQAVKRGVRKSVDSDASAGHLEALLAETCVAEWMHWALLVISPVMFLTMDFPWSLGGYAIYAFSNLPLIAIQRYNRPRLAVLLQRERRKEERRGRREK